MFIDDRYSHIFLFENKNVDKKARKFSKPKKVKN